MNIHHLPEKNNRKDHTLEERGVPFYWRVLAPLIAFGGGLFGVIGAMFTELTHKSFLIAFIGAPIIEEAMKPSGVYLLLIKWPGTLRNQRYTALLAALGGLAFALVENLLYLNIYVQKPSPQLVLWRYTVCVGVHTVCSFIAGHGINEKLLMAIRGNIKFLSFDKRFFIVAMVLHCLYNIFAVLFEGALGFHG